MGIMDILSEFYGIERLLKLKSNPLLNLKQS